MNLRIHFLVLLLSLVLAALGGCGGTSGDSFAPAADSPGTGGGSTGSTVDGEESDGLSDANIPSVLWAFRNEQDHGMHLMFNYNCYNQETPAFNTEGTDYAKINAGWGGPENADKNYVLYDHRLFGSGEGQWAVTMNGERLFWRTNVKSSFRYHAKWADSDNCHFQYSDFSRRPMAIFGCKPGNQAGYDMNYTRIQFTSWYRYSYHQHVAFMPFPVCDDLCRVTQEPINGDKYTVRVNDFRRWMTTLNSLNDQIGSQPLGAWIIPGSHDACTGFIDKEYSDMFAPGTSLFEEIGIISWEQIAALGQTHELNLYDQLTAGSRFFDMRPTWGWSDFFWKWNPGGGLYVQHTAIFGTLKDQFALVKKWLDDIDNHSHHEVIVLWFDTMNNCADGSALTQPWEDNWEKCLTDSGIDKYVIQNDGRPPFSRTLEDLTQGNRHVILLMDNYKIKNTGEMLKLGPNWFPNSPNVSHSYSDKITPYSTDNYNRYYYDEMNKTVDPPTLGLLGCEKYFTDNDYITIGTITGGIYCLGFMEGLFKSLYDYINVVKTYESRFRDTRRSYIVDFYSPMATQLALSLNYDIAKTVKGYHSITHPIFPKNVVSVYKGASDYYYVMNTGNLDGSSDTLPRYKVYNNANGEVADGTVNWNGTITFKWGSGGTAGTGTITALSDFLVPSTLEMTAPGDTLTIQGTPMKDPATDRITFKPFDGVKVPSMDPVTGKISWDM
ncbi:MAG: hypothetical protein AB2L14_20460 [Candidatus Xenobiia bacterium LiM19]